MSNSRRLKSKSARARAGAGNAKVSRSGSSGSRRSSASATRSPSSATKSTRVVAIVVVVSMIVAFAGGTLALFASDLFGSDESPTTTAAGAPDSAASGAGGTNPQTVTCAKDSSPDGGKGLPCPPAKPTVDPNKTYTATIVTSDGTMKFTLDPKTALVDVNNFVYLADKGFYSGSGFHRIIPGFVAQGGSPVANDPSQAGIGGPGYKYTGSTPAAGTGASTYKVGSLAMANSGDVSTNGSQFFIVAGPQGAQLPPNYSLFGQMTEGSDVLAKIVATPTGAQDFPKTPVTIESVTITTS